MNEIKKRIDNTPVGFEEVEDAQAAVVAEMLEELRLMECDTKEIVDMVVTTLATFSARVLHRLFSKKTSENNKEE